jgi:uncharacterized membrane protein
VDCLHHVIGKEEEDHLVVLVVLLVVLLLLLLLLLVLLAVAVVVVVVVLRPVCVLARYFAGSIATPKVPSNPFFVATDRASRRF